MAYIDFINVSKSFDNHKVLHDVNISIEKNEFVTLLGSSGCGKTTLLRLLSGFENLDSGKIILDNEDITNKNPKDRNIGMIFQSYSLFPTMTVFDNVAYGLKIKKCNKNTIKKEVMLALEAVNMLDKKHKYPSFLSGGEKQRVALARSLVMKPKVLLLDEPFSAIDAKLRKFLQVKVKELHKKYKMTSIMVTHDQNEAMVMADRIYLLKSGKVEQSGRPRDLYLKPKTKYAASFMGNYNILTADMFSKITLNNHNQYKTVVLRPEAIVMSKMEFKIDKNFYYTKGVIENYIIQGNVARFIVKISDVRLNVDTLIDELNNFSIGEQVYLSMDSSKILFYNEEV